MSSDAPKWQLELKESHYISGNRKYKKRTDLFRSDLFLPIVSNYDIRTLLAEPIHDPLETLLFACKCRTW